MSLKELTAASHEAAENTKFMRAVFANKMPLDVWADFAYQKSLIYNAIEGGAGALGLLDNLKDLRRTFLLWKDYQIMTDGQSIMFKFEGAVFKSVTRDELGMIVATGAGHIQTAFDWESQKYAEIDVCETIEQLKLVDLTYPESE